MVFISGEIFDLSLSIELTTQVVSLGVGMYGVSLNGVTLFILNLFFN